MKYIATIDGCEYAIEINDQGVVSLNDTPLQVNFDQLSDRPICSLLLDGKSYEAFVYPNDEGLQVLLYGQLYTVTVEDEQERSMHTNTQADTGAHAEYLLKAPMPGLVLSIPVVEGQEVKKGDVLLILESMKMQNELKAPHGGTVMRLRVQPGDRVEQKQALLSIVANP